MRRPTPKKPPVDLARNLIQGASGALLGGALLGLVEACYHLVSGGVPDLLSPLYGVLLYAAIAFPLGLGAGIVLSVGERLFGPVHEATAWAWGFGASIAPLLVFILYYLANKVVYLEQGVPTDGKITVLVLGLGIPALVVLLLPFPLSGGLRVMLKAKGLLGAMGALVLVTGLVSLAPVVPDPRADWAHGRSLTPAVAGGPDVLLIMVDTLRADHLEPYGATFETPAFRSLADDGITFERAYAQASWTRSSGASLFTSRLPSSHGAATKSARLSPEVVTYAEALQAGGVVNGALINNPNLTATFGFDQGFDTFYYAAPAYPLGATESVFALTLYKVVHKLSERLLPGAKQVEQYYRPADAILADAQRFIDANDGSRWSLFVHLMEPHDPYFEHPVINGSGPQDYNGEGFARAEHEHPDPARADELRQVYADEVAFLDTQLAPFLAWLRETDRYDDTLIVVTSDHGEEFHEHGGWWHGTTLYEEQIHVPLIVKLPRQEHAGARVPWTVRLIDVAPTLTTALGLAPGEGWQGRDLLGEVRETLAATAEDDAVDPVEPIADHAEDEATDEATEGDADAASEPEADAEADAEDTAAPDADTPMRGHPLDRVVVAEEDFEGNVLSAIAKGGFKALFANEGNPRGLPTRALYDLATDPGEQHELLEAGRAIEGLYPVDLVDGLKGDLDAILSASSQQAAEGGDAALTASECAQLKALGYLTGDEGCE